MHVNRTYRFRLYPTQKQLIQLNEYVLYFRSMFNLLEKANRNRFERTQTFYQETDREVLLHKAIEKYKNLQNIPFFLLDCASKSFFKELHSKNKNQAVVISPNHKWFILFHSFTFSSNRLFVPSIGNIKFVQSRSLGDKVHSVRFFEYHDKWYISVHVSYSVSEYIPPLDRKIKVVGIDLGLSSFATLSTGQVIEHPKYLYQYEEKINLEQKKLAKKEAGSNNWQEQKEKLQKFYDKLTNSRTDFLHKISSAIVEQYDVIGIESLSVQSMLKNRHLSKSIYDTGLSTFSHFVNYKSQERSKFLVEVDRYFPSSQMCHKCSHIQEMPLSERTYHCFNCGNIEDRDINAAKNIANYAKAEFVKSLKREC